MDAAQLQQISTPEKEAPNEELASPEKVFVECPAPEGWKKKLVPVKSRGTPRRREVIFVAPDGEEIKTRKHLERYLKGHPGGPPLTEFDWSSGETPRRSARLSSKRKPSEESPEGGSGGKRSKRKVSKEEPPKEVEVTEEGPVKKEEVMEDVVETEEVKNDKNVAAEANGEGMDGGKAEEQEGKSTAEELINESVEAVQHETSLVEEVKPEGTQVNSEKPCEEHGTDDVADKIALNETSEKAASGTGEQNGTVFLGEELQQMHEGEDDQHIVVDAEKSLSIHVETDTQNDQLEEVPHTIADAEKSSGVHVETGVKNSLEAVGA
eukprot:c27135_g1_i1 orf=354-1322(+)